MKHLIALAIWAALLSPAIELGKTWQSYAMPGALVTANFGGDETANGRFFFKADGSRWMVSEDGTMRSLESAKILTLKRPPANEQELPFDPAGNLLREAITDSLRGILPPLGLTTIMLLWLLASTRRAAAGRAGLR